MLGVGIAAFIVGCWVGSLVMRALFSLTKGKNG